MTKPTAAHRVLNILAGKWMPGEFFLLNRVDAVMADTVVRSMGLSAFERESGVRAGFPKHRITGEFPARGSSR